MGTDAGLDYSYMADANRTERDFYEMKSHQLYRVFYAKIPRVPPLLEVRLYLSSHPFFLSSDHS